MSIHTLQNTDNENDMIIGLFGLLTQYIFNVIRMLQYFFAHLVEGVALLTSLSLVRS